MNIAYGSNVISNLALFIAYKGIKYDLVGSLRIPITPEIKGILNFFLDIANFCGAIFPY